MLAGPPLVVVVNKVRVSELDMEMEGVRHRMRRVEGFLLCPCCDVKATSGIVMQSHLGGKKHKNKIKLAKDGVGGKDTSVAVSHIKISNFRIGLKFTI
jgi:hypothetical protein